MTGKKIFFILSVFLLFSLSVQADRTVEIDNNWNLISPPAEDISVDELEQEGCDLVGGPWGWDTQDQEYYFAEEMSPAQGYWIKASDTCSFSQEGPPAPPEPIQLEKGNWHLVSIPAYTSVLDFNPLVDKCGMKEGGGGPWTATTGEYSYEEGIEPNRGYFIKAGSDCQMELDTDQSNTSDDESDGSDSEDSSSDNTDEEISESSSDLNDAHNGWTYESSVEADRYGVTDDGVMVLEHSGCGKIYYEREYEEGETVDLSIDFQAENWDGVAGAWYTNSDDDLELDTQSIDGVSDSSNVEKSGEINIKQGSDGPVQIGFSADIGLCGDVGNAEMRVEMK